MVPSLAEEVRSGDPVVLQRGGTDLFYTLTQRPTVWTQIRCVAKSPGAPVPGAGAWVATASTTPEDRP